MTTEMRPSHDSTTAGTRIITVLRHRWPTLLALALAVIFPFVLPESRWTSPLALISGVLAYPICGVIRRQLRGPAVIALQTAAFVGFVGLALGTLAMDPVLGRYLLAAGWLAHGIWDYAHHRVDRIVPRWLSEFCAVIDVLTAASLIIVPLL